MFWRITLYLRNPFRHWPCYVKDRREEKKYYTFRDLICWVLSGMNWIMHQGNVTISMHTEFLYSTMLYIIGCFPVWIELCIKVTSRLACIQNCYIQRCYIFFWIYKIHFYFSFNKIRNISHQNNRDCKQQKSLFKAKANQHICVYVCECM